MSFRVLKIFSRFSGHRPSRDTKFFNPVLEIFRVSFRRALSVSRVNFRVGSRQAAPTDADPRHATDALTGPKIAQPQQPRAFQSRHISEMKLSGKPLILAFTESENHTKAEIGYFLITVTGGKFCAFTKNLHFSRDPGTGLSI